MNFYRNYNSDISLFLSEFYQTRILFNLTE